MGSNLTEKKFILGHDFSDRVNGREVIESSAVCLWHWWEILHTMLENRERICQAGCSVAFAFSKTMKWCQLLSGFAFPLSSHISGDAVTNLTIGHL